MGVRTKGKGECEGLSKGKMLQELGLVVLWKSIQQGREGGYDREQGGWGGVWLF